MVTDETRDPDDCVRIGSIVRLAGARSAEVDEITLVRTRHEQGINRLHVGTALGAALLGRRRGDEVPVCTDAGTVTFVILDVAG